MRKKRNKKILMIILSISLLFGVSFSGFFNTNKLASIINDSANTLVYYTFGLPINSITSYINKYTSLTTVYEENKALHQLLDDYASAEAKNSLLAKENEELRKLVNLVSLLTDYQLQTGRIIGRNLDTWKNSITINLGSHNNITKNMAVINSEGLIGVISEVADFSSKVELLTAHQSSIDVAIMIMDDEFNTTYGVVTGYDSNKKAYTLKMLDNNEFTKVGMAVTTSGYGGTIPRGLYLGEIIEITNNPNLSYPTIYVKPHVNFDDLSYIAVVRGGQNE